MKGKVFRIELDEFDLGQIIDGLETRADAWEKTSEYHRNGEAPSKFIVEECSDYHEAHQIAAHYRSIILKIQERRREQT